MNKKQATPVEESPESEDENVVKGIARCVSHWVVHVELVNPIQAGGHKRSYLRYNVEHNVFDMEHGVMTLPRIGDQLTRIPISNIVCWHEIHRWIPNYDDTDEWRYEPCEGFIQKEHPVGYFYSGDVGFDSIGWLYECGEIIRPTRD